VRAFLTTRRERLTPDAVGMVGGGRRRVPGLRREEVALLAGVSTDYYVRMERGNLSGVSTEILHSLASALLLSDAETEHFLDLARGADPAASRRRRTSGHPAVRPSLQRVLDAMTDAPAVLCNTRQDLVATNALGRELFSPLLEDPAVQGNTVRFVFLSPASRLFFPDWDAAAASTVASLRVAAAQNPSDRPLTNLIGEVVTRSDHFRRLWAAHDIRHHETGAKHLVHPQVGDLHLTFDRLDLPGATRWMMFAYTAVAGSPTADRLRLLGSLAATREAAAGDGGVALRSRSVE